MKEKWESKYVLPRGNLLIGENQSICLGFSGGSVVKNLPTKQKMWVQSLGREDPLEKEMATRSRILPREIPWTEEPGGCSPWICRVTTE